MNLSRLLATAVGLTATADAVDRHRRSIGQLKARSARTRHPKTLAACDDLISDHYDRIADILDSSPAARRWCGLDAHTARALADAYFIAAEEHLFQADLDQAEARWRVNEARRRRSA
jgi:hypothetical protein